MNSYEQPEVEKKLEELTDQLGYFVLEALLMSLQKINHENGVLKEFLDVKLETQTHEPLGALPVSPQEQNENQRKND